LNFRQGLFLGSFSFFDIVGVGTTGVEIIAGIDALTGAGDFRELCKSILR
jgi:hypothetical protein